MTPSLYWHDYETFGVDPQRDRPAQFAGIRTDTGFNIIDEPFVVYCKLATDSLPHPDACLITGITPQLAGQKGVCEAEFIRLIHTQLAHPNTCALGYNSIRFDDEVTRNCLYRNFYDAYAREWQYGNSRWDLIDVARAAWALRPKGIQWPVDGQGKPSFRLDQLTLANGIVHDNAHDALADVYATIAIAKLIKDKQPKLYQFLWQHRAKNDALKLLQLGGFCPVVHVSGKYPSIKHCLAIVLPICKHPGNSNGVIVYDLSVNPEPMLALTAEDIRQRIFTANDGLPEGISRIPLKTVHINKCPVLAPISVIRPEDAERLQLDLKLCYENLAAIKSAPELPVKLAEVFDDRTYSREISDPDLAIYSGGFFTDFDKQQMAKICKITPEALATAKFQFSDVRLPEMLFRYRGRNYPETLNAEETQKWKQFCLDRLTGIEADNFGISLKEFFSQLQLLENSLDVKLEILESLNDYAHQKMRYLGLSPNDLVDQ
ncbi:MAG: exodeoxyribonuclease I [Methylovulum sp.]|uniref:exodeoxyribonuclease I n=1 Tax=Methylovulum sp. TaxID=1916980 RepID=UPI00260A5880|nr:exodeoxyribonuclease I [Methylovulum sp.]MDD2723071.1 exodeoxyribonuclease I [Methylovulum sp.]MDD5123740.1 exodeoxyribonuclease I [Methylovulum sp.]